MNTLIAYPLQTDIFVPELVVCGATILHEIFTYPLSHLGVRQMGRIDNISRGNILNHREFHLIYNELNQQGQCFRGLWLGLDKQLSKQLIRYYFFHYTYYRFAYKDYVKNDYNPDIEQDQTYNPQNPEIFPLLKYINIFDPKTILITVIVNLIAMIASQPVNILKSHVQNEAFVGSSANFEYNQKMRQILKHNKNKMIFLKPGFTLRFTRNYVCFLSEIILFQKFLRNDGYEFMNVFSNEQKVQPSTTIIRPLFYAGLISAFLTTFTHPFYLIEKRQIQFATQNKNLKFQEHIKQIYQHEGLNGYSKGYITNLIRNVSRNMFLMASLWVSAKSYNKNRFEHHGRFY